MATLTAQMLIGSPHPQHDGILPTHYLFLSENNRPVLVLVQQNIFQSKEEKPYSITWIPTKENMLEDALLMIAVNVLRDKEILEIVESEGIKIDSNRFDLNDDINELQRNQLYQKCRSVENFPKVILSFFEGSSLKGRLGVLKYYSMDVEVCSPVYSCLFSVWRNETRIKGSLERT